MYKTTMNPNDNYAERYPTEFYNAQSQTIGDMIRRCGLFAFTLAVFASLGLYEILVQSFGPQYANFIMDFAMYSIQYKTNVFKDFETNMQGQALFSDGTRSDTWISNFASHIITQSQIETFKVNWLNVCKQRGMKKVWLYIDGSNNDTSSENSEIAEKGRAKSKKSPDIYAYMYAVSAEDGTPVTYSLSRGGQVDSKSFHKILAYLTNSGLEVEGVILDRGFCDNGTVNTIVDSGYKYVIMMKESMNGFKQMLQKHGSEILNNGDFLVDPGIFATVDKEKIFAESKEESYIALVYDAKNAGERIKQFTKNVLKAIREYKEAVIKGLEYVIPPKVSKYLVENEEKKVLETNDEFQAELNRKGYSALACSDPFSASEILHLYDLRDASEKQFMILKTQLGYGVGRSHEDEGLESRHLMGFVAGIIRNGMEKHSKETKYELITALHEMNFMVLNRIAAGEKFMAIRNMNGKQLDLMKSVGLTAEDLDYIADRESRKVNHEVYDQVAKLPSQKCAEEKVRKSNAGADSGEEVQVQKRPGRKAGTPNRSKEEIAAEKKRKEIIRQFRNGRKGRLSREDTERLNQLLADTQ